MLLTSVCCCSSVHAAKKKPGSKAVRVQLDPGGCQGLGLAAPKLLRGCPPRPEGPEEQRNRGFDEMLGPFLSFLRARVLTARGHIRAVQAQSGRPHACYTAPEQFCPLNPLAVRELKHAFPTVSFCLAPTRPPPLPPSYMYNIALTWRCLLMRIDVQHCVTIPEPPQPHLFPSQA